LHIALAELKEHRTELNHQWKSQITLLLQTLKDTNLPQHKNLKESKESFV
jgi:hypothetical protein